jgi:M6 family metalloprotease-like protein
MQTADCRSVPAYSHGPFGPSATASAVVAVLAAVVMTACESPPGPNAQERPQSLSAARPRSATAANGPVRAAALGVAAPQEFMKPFGTIGRREGSWKAIFICFDPGRQGQGRSFEYAEAGSLMWGDDGGESLHDWFNKNSEDHFNLGWTATRGCLGANGSYGPPADHPAAQDGDWYDRNKRWDLMWVHAIERASQEFDFASFDADGNGHITPDELVVIVSRPQSQPYGTFRGSAINVTVNGKNLLFDVVDAYLTADPAFRRWNAGILSHEIMHAVGGAADMYERNGVKDPLSMQFVSVRSAHPNRYSIMDDHTGQTFLDAYHRLKLNWVEPFVWDATLGVRQLWLDAVGVTNGGAHVIHDPARGTKEFFIVENRSTAARPDGGINYDATLPSSGVALWHIVEDFDLAAQRPEPGYDPHNWSLNKGDWGRSVVRFVGLCNQDNPAPIPLIWSDGKPSGMALICRGQGADGRQLIDIAPP